jgi:predicted negative regulator of RcsB-dependent stress response
LKTWRKKTGKKKEQFTKPDEFQSLTQKAMAYVQENTQKVYIVLGVLGVIIIAAIVVTLLMQSSHKRVTDIEAEALKYYDINSPVPGTKPMAATNRLIKARDLFTGISDKAAVALYYKANSDMELGDIDTAIGSYMKLKEKTKDPVLTSLVDIRLAEAYLVKGDTQKAVGAYMDDIKAEKGFMKDLAHFRLAGIYQKAGEKDRAIQEYKVIEKEFPNSPYLGEASQNLALLEGRPMPAAASVQAAPVAAQAAPPTEAKPAAKAAAPAAAVPAGKK